MKKVLLSVLLIFVAAAAGEGTVRLLHRARGEPYDGAAAKERLLRTLAAANGELVPGATRDGASAGEVENATFLHPFYGWETKFSHEGLVRHVTAFRRGDTAGEYVIVVLGGSVAAMFTGPDTGASELMERSLEADPRFAGRRVRLLSHGRGAFKQPQQVFVLSWLLALGFVPNAVINLDGFNEVAITNQNRGYHVHPLFPSFPQWGSQLRSNLVTGSPALTDDMIARRIEMRNLAQQTLDRRYAASAILGPWALGRIGRAERRWKEAQQAVLKSAWDESGTSDVLGPPFGGDEDEAIEMGVRIWRDASRDLEAICARRGIAYLHVLQPTLHDAGSKPVTEEERKTGAAAKEWREAVRRGYPRLREEGAAMRAEGFPFFDASMVFGDVQESLYIDACHFRREGNAILAAAVAEAFLAQALRQ